MICDRLDLNVWEIIEAAATKPFGFMKFTPGPSLGGHCIPIDPLYLSWKMRGLNYEARFVDLADKVNAEMPHHVVVKVMEGLNDDGKSLMGARVSVPAVACKNDIDDVRESPALLIIEQLRKKRADVFYHDAHIPDLAGEIEGEMRSVVLDEDELTRADCAVVVTAHSNYDWSWVTGHSHLVVDTRNALAGCPRQGADHRPLVTAIMVRSRRLGYIGIGRSLSIMRRLCLKGDYLLNSLCQFAFSPNEWSTP